MKKIILIFSLMIFGVIPLTQAKAIDIPFFDFFAKISQNILPSGAINSGSGVNTSSYALIEGETSIESFQEQQITRQEVQQTLKELKNIQAELTKLGKSLKKTINSFDDMAELNGLLEQAKNFENLISQGEDPAEITQEFRDAQMQDELASIRAKASVPREITRWNKDIKKLESILKQKKYQSLGFDIENLKLKIEEAKSVIKEAGEDYKAGDLETAVDEISFLAQDLSVSDIIITIQKIQALSVKLKSIKDQEAKSKIQDIFSEVIASFDKGDYKLARQLTEESFTEISSAIYKAISVGKKKGVAKESFFQIVDELKIKISNIAKEKQIKNQQEQERQFMMQVAPGQIFIQPVQVNPSQIQPIQAESSSGSLGGGSESVAAPGTIATSSESVAPPQQ